MAWALETTCTEDDVPTVSRSHDSNVVAQSTMRLDAPAFLPTFSAPPSKQYFSPKQAPSPREFVVGDENNLWAVPSSIDEFNKWAEKTRFQIGDSLVLKYDSKSDSMLEVTEEDYKISQAPSPQHHHHHYHAPVLAPTNGGTGLKATEGFICGTTMVGSLVLLCRVSAAARMHPELALHIAPTNYLEMPENQAVSPPSQAVS
ncbi:early nodulin-16-like [Olea europaea var. sylvestris]|uniref:early nodulin-16-like n=1 Tax=Olea europaea var. sylvestris TaxID=158386 RepID=UPI000C1D3C9C|nr:early nodulin-16-like [Olea europaea var. sylvestris]